MNPTKPRAGARLLERLRPIAIFGYCTGWRKNEVLGLEWRHVDREAQVVRLDPGETKNEVGSIRPVRVRF